MKLQPMVHVEDLNASLEFYESLGAAVLHADPDGDFALLQLADGTELSLLAHPPNPEQHEGEVELNFEATTDELAQFASSPYAVGDVESTGFGQQLILRSPGGLLIKLNRFGD